MSDLRRTNEDHKEVQSFRYSFDRASSDEPQHGAPNSQEAYLATDHAPKHWPQISRPQQ